MVPVIDEIARRTAVLVLHPFLNRKRRHETRCDDRSVTRWMNKSHHDALTKLMPVTIGMTLDLMRCWGESDPAFLTSAKNLGRRRSAQICLVIYTGVPFPVLFGHVMRRKRMRIQLTRRWQLWEPAAQILAVRDQAHGWEGVVRELGRRLTIPHWWRAFVAKKAAERHHDAPLFAILGRGRRRASIGHRRACAVDVPTERRGKHRVVRAR